MDLVEFDLANSPEHVRAHLETLEPATTEGLDFGVLAFKDGQIVGRILLAIRHIAPMLTGALDLLDFEGEDTARPILEREREGFVLTFGVDPAHRRQGIGTALQLAAIESCRRRGLYQMRGWSSHNKPETYRMKLRLGFAAVPGVQFIERKGKWVPGTYFVLPLSVPGSRLEP